MCSGLDDDLQLVPAEDVRPEMHDPGCPIGVKEEHLEGIPQLEDPNLIDGQSVHRGEVVELRASMTTMAVPVGGRHYRLRFKSAEIGRPRGASAQVPVAPQDRRVTSNPWPAILCGHDVQHDVMTNRHREPAGNGLRLALGLSRRFPQAPPATATTASSNGPSGGALAAVFVQVSGVTTAMFQLFQYL